MATPEQLAEAENKAAYVAMRAYLDTLESELGRIQEATIMGALGTTVHQHYALVIGSNKGIIRFAINYDESEAAKTLVLGLAHERGDI
jgi:hypothetical protein